MTELSVLGLIGLTAAVAFGSFIPVLPTGPMVSGGAVLAHETHPVAVLLIVGAGAAGAFAGDLATFSVFRRAGIPVARRLPWLRVDEPGGTMKTVAVRLERHAVRAFVLARLVPGGRIPVLLTAAVGGFAAPRFIVSNIPAVLIWACLYAVIGFAGNALLPSPRVALVVTVSIALCVSVLPGLVRQRRSSRVT